MIKKQMKKSALAAAIAGVVALAGAPSAQAVVISGSWDPKYGTPFEGIIGSSTDDDMWWSGNALFTIPNECLTSSDVVTSGTCPGMFVSNAEVELRVGQFGTPLETLVFTGNLALNEVSFNGDGNVEWVKSDFWVPLVTGTSSTFSLSNYFFSLGFDVDGAMLFHTDKQAFLDAHGTHGHQPDQFWNGVGKGHLGELCSPTSGIPDGDRCGFSDDYGTMVFAPIPEPSTYALMFAGLAAIGFMARRRRQQA